jgi:hypothetical protein
MPTKDNLNAKALQELILYYLRERISGKNIEVKHLIVTNIYEWFIFNANDFDRLFAQNKKLVKQFTDFEEGRLADTKTDFFYKQIAEPFLNELDSEISFTWLDIRNYEKIIKNNDKPDDNKLVALFKLFSPENLLKLPFTNDSNSLDKGFYAELLHIIGLQETKEGNKKLIGRKTTKERNAGSFIENTVTILKYEDCLSQIKAGDYGKNQDEQLYNVALELVITWINRVLFLKLLEGQLVKYHSGDKSFKFLNTERIPDFDTLNKLFFQVLAIKESERNELVKNKFGNIPYLNSSLFEPGELEHKTVRISNLEDEYSLPILSSTVLKDKTGKKQSGELNSLEYLFAFLDSYDFASEGAEEIQEENKTLINASVLGLIFEKINGYKDGSFFTPGFITMYMCRETIQRAIVQKFNETKNWKCKTIDDLYDKIDDKKEANQIINDLKICDPAVGSGHFLVSALNEIIAIKNDLRILSDREGKRLKEYHVEVVNDELVVTDEDGELFEYNPKNKESQRIQESLFHEKQTIIENCLFGVDINHNSVKICRLRLWIELLKRAYYTEESNYMELEVLPNIDINIKGGNSLVSRFELDSDLKSVFKNSDYTLDDYKDAVRNYKETGDRDEKKRLKVYIDDVKKNFEVGLRDLHPERQKLKVKEGKLVELTTQFDMFGDEIEGEAGSRKVRIKMAEQELAKQKEKVEALESGAFYNQAFEWRFEFPEVLDDEGRFTGFDVVIGNPPYVRQEQFKELKPYLKDRYTVYQGTADLYSYFIELGIDLLTDGGYFQYIVANKWMRSNYGQSLREWLQKKVNINAIYDFGDLPVFEEATTYPCLLQLSKTESTGLFWATEIETLDFDLLEDYLNENRFESDQTKLLPDGWALIDEKAQRLLEKLKDRGIPLGEYVNGKFFYGIKTGLNKAFVINEETKKKLIKETPEAQELIKPFLAGKEVKRYHPPKATKYLILIPSGWTIKKTDRDEKWNWFLKHYTSIAKHLSQFEDQARKRYDQGEYWWELRPSTYYNEFEKSKIMYAEIATRGQFTLDNNKNYLDTTGFIMGSASKSLLGILNSSIWTFMFSSISSEIRGGFYRWKKQYMEVMPLPESFKENEELETLVDQVLTAKKENPETDTTDLESEIDRLVYELYGLSEEEIGIVEGK